MAISLIQTGNHTDNNGGIHVFTFASPNQVGDLLWFNARIDGGSAISLITATDSAGNTWQVASLFSPSSNSHVTMYAYNVAAYNNAGAGVTVTVVENGGNNEAQITYREYSGIRTSSNPLDQASSDNTATSTTATSASVTTTAPGELLIGAVMNTTANGLTITAGSGYGNVVNNAGNAASEDQIQVSAGAVTASFGLSSSVQWHCFINTFFAATAATTKHFLPLLGVGR